MSKAKFQIKIEEMLLKYINRFLRYAKFSHLPQDRKELLIGTFLYLLEENDIIPDNVPNIGYLDDLMVFIYVAKSFVENGQTIPGVCKPVEIAKDFEFIESNKGLIFGQCDLSIATIRNKGKVEVELSKLCTQIKEKYQHLGSVEE